MIIYLDMDDVVADWMAKAQEVLNMTWPPGEQLPQTDWDKIKADERFYRHLPLKTGARQLVAWCEDYVNKHKGTEIRFLSALPHDYSMPWAAQDKVYWAREHFPTIPVFLGPFSHDKWRHCRSGDVLIDDRQSNCSEWILVGGQAHVYRTWAECKIWLEETLR